MEQKYWIGVACASHIRRGVDAGICAFGHGKLEAVGRLKSGDRFIYYATRENYENGSSCGNPVQAFIASGTVKSFEPINSTLENGPTWIKEADYDPPIYLPIKPILDKLSFVKNKTSWGMAFRRSLFEIPMSDFETILQISN